MKKLYLGVAREIITPKIGGQLYGYSPDVFSESVEDDLTVTAFYFKQGNTQALMLSVTVCLIQTELADNILALIEQKCKIPKENCMLCATHTHSGPNTCGQAGWGDIDSDYCTKIFVPRILLTVKKAILNMQSVKMGVAAGNSFVGINRRELNIENNIKLGQNPWGIFNPKMTIVSFVNDSQKNIANLIHYGAHGTAAGKNHEITRDWSGIMLDELEKQSGAITAFFNGPEGDVGPRLTNGKTVGDISHVHALGNIAAKDAVRIYKNISDYCVPELLVSHKDLTVPLKKRIEKEVAIKQYEAFKKKTVNHEGMTKVHFEKVLASYKNGVTDQPSCKVRQTVIAIGDIVFASFPYELFSEIGMRIDRAIKTKTVLSLSNTNGSEGYFVTKDAICRGGYEVTMFLYGHLQQFTDDADFYLMQESVKHIQNLIDEE